MVRYPTFCGRPYCLDYRFYWQKSKLITRKELCEKIYDPLTLLCWQNFMIIHCLSGNVKLTVKFALLVKTGLKYQMPSCKKNLCSFQQYGARPVCCTANSRPETQTQYYLFSFLFGAPKPKYLFLTEAHD